MARYTGPVTRKSRRLGVDLVGGSEAFERRPYPPGQHGRARIKESEYLLQLKEKQKARFMYGVMEKQFSRYYKEAKAATGKTGDALLQILETRLDNVVFRMGFASTRAEARQMVSHKAITVNGASVNIPSYLVKAGDAVAVREKSKTQARVVEALELAKQIGFPAWVEVAADKAEGVFKKTPDRDEFASDINESLIVELYSR